jgi:CDP-paratose 2-epimerase
VYTIFGYDGKQVRDNIHSADVVKAFEAFHSRPQVAAVYNLGGGRHSNVSMREAIAMCETIAQRELHYTVAAEPRVGDHRWYISDFGAFRRDYPEFELTYGIDAVLREIYDVNVDHWQSAAAA